MHVPVVFEVNAFDIRSCRQKVSNAGCSSTMFIIPGTSYNKVCGKILAYQYHHTDAFRSFHREENPSIDSNYVDGVSLTYGSHPRQHIWTFASALDELGSVLEGEAVCSCSNPSLSGQQLSPSFIGQDYFCDSGVRGSYFYRIADPFYVEDLLWDGAGCGPNVTCCSFNNPPWFHKVLPSPTIDDIEMRVCRDEPSSWEDQPLQVLSYMSSNNFYSVITLTKEVVIMHKSTVNFIAALSFAIFVFG